ncbi:MAG: ABC transporter transmembrane domain-containing protein, partial [bacterium]|nr:ABC transporter transmembrane domain-containing protein [bacterium]
MIRSAIIKVFRSSWALCLLLLVTMVGGMVLQLVPPLLVRHMIDQYFSLKIMEGVWRLALLYLAVVSAGSLVQAVKVVITTWLGQQVLVELKSSMALHLSRLPMKYFYFTPVGEVMSRLTSDVDAINTLFSAGVVSLATDLLRIVGLMGAMYIMSPPLFG